jgi:hypothetical protein
MATVESNMASKSGLAVSSSQAGQPTIQSGNYELTKAQAEDATVLLRILKLPAQHRIVGLVLAIDDVSTGADITLDVGIEDTVGSTTDATLCVDGSALGQAGGVADVTSMAALELAAANNDRYITIDISVAATTGAAGGVRVVLTSVPEQGTQFAG